MFVAGQWLPGRVTQEVRSPYDETVIDTAPVADLADLESALHSAVEGSRVMRAMSAFDRSQILGRAAAAMHAQSERLARLITAEEGKTLAEARAEVSRAIETMSLSSEESKRLGGETLPLDGAPGGAGKLGFTLRIPCGVVAAITPFNFPLNLVCHKVGPAIAAGNAIVLKPASDTPLSALTLVEILLNAGLPPLGISCVTGSGSLLGPALCADRRVRKISFTGSRDVGEMICKTAGIKRVTMELGANCPLIVMDDADLDSAADIIASSGFVNAGQTCISTQRVLATRKIYGDLLDAIGPRVDAITIGNPLDESTRMGPMIRERDAERVESWIKQAVDAGAKIVSGGKRVGSLHQATVLADVDPRQPVSCHELFGPAVACTRAEDLNDAIALANDSRYGLSASILTRDLTSAMRFIQEVDSGNLHINWGPQWRADLMPYGGLKESGFGREGPRYAIDEMSDFKSVVIHGLPVAKAAN